MTTAKEKGIWVSDGKDVWHIMAHKDGSHKQAPLCKFWMDARWPAPPTMIRGDRD